MPVKPPVPCYKPGCTHMQPCPVHSQKKNELDMNRPSASRRGYDRRWQKLRLMFLRASPLCIDPFGIHAEDNQAVPAVHVDHIMPKAEGGQDEWDNLQPLCHSCHSKKTNIEKQGGDVKSLRQSDSRPMRGQSSHTRRID